MTVSKTKTDETETSAGLRARLDNARTAAGNVSGALTTGGQAYVSGLLDLGRTLLGFGREVASETGGHARATFRAKNLREVGELQAAFVQHRLEMTATHAKEFADLARARSEAVIEPITALLKQDKAA